MITELLAPFVSLLTEGLKLWRDQLDWKKKTYKETRTNELDDEIDVLAADGSPAAKLRLERLNQRKQRVSEF